MRRVHSRITSRRPIDDRSTGRLSGGLTGSFGIVSNREWPGRRLPLWTLVFVGVVLLGVAALLLFLVDSKLVFLAVSPLTMVGPYTLAYAGGEWRRRSDKQRGR